MNGMPPIDHKIESLPERVAYGDFAVAARIAQRSGTMRRVATGRSAWWSRSGAVLLVVAMAGCGTKSAIMAEAGTGGARYTGDGSGRGRTRAVNRSGECRWHHGRGGHVASSSPTVTVR